MAHLKISVLAFTILVTWGTFLYVSVNSSVEWAIMVELLLTVIQRLNKSISIKCLEWGLYNMCYINRAIIFQ